MSLSRLVLVLALATAGCAAEPAKPAGPPSPFDGVYSGTATLTEKKGDDCDATQARTLTIASGQGSLLYNGKVGTLTGAVGPNGDVMMAAGKAGKQTVLTGKIAGTTFTGKTDNPNCTYAVTLTKK
jgi:hypothetical protein